MAHTGNERLRAGSDADPGGRRIARRRAERAGEQANARADEKRDAPTGGQVGAGTTRASGQVQAGHARHAGPSSRRERSAPAEIYGEQEIIAGEHYAAVDDSTGHTDYLGDDGQADDGSR